LSWSISNTMDSDLVMGVLNEALRKYNHPEIFNTDQGSQYTSHIHTGTLKEKGITISMDGKGRATDNICIERFWRSAKCEKIYLNEYNRLTELKDDVKTYIEFYNHRRFHETLGYKKPMNVYNEGEIYIISFQIKFACCSVVHRRFWLLPKSNHYPRRWFCLRRPPPYRSSKKQAYSLVFESQYCVYGSTGWEIPSSFQRSKRYAQSLNGAERQPF